MPSIFERLTRRKYVTFENSPLVRALNVVDLTMLGVGSTVGVGFYVLAGGVARNTAGPAVTISFLIAAIASVFSGLCYAEFGARVPKAGSSYVYSYVCVGEFIAFVIGWNLILEYVIGTASVARGYSGYVNELSNDAIFDAFKAAMPMNVDVLSPYPDFFAFSMTIALSVILSIGVKESSRANNLFTGVNLFVIVYTIIAGATQADPDNWHLTDDQVDINNNDTICTEEKGSHAGSDPWGDGGFAPYGFEGIIQGAATCFYGFVGFDIIATTGEEALNPERNIPISIICSLAIVFFAYFGMSTIITLALPYCLQDVDAPLIVLFKELDMTVSMWIVSIGALFGFSASLMGAMFPMPRVIYAMADDGLLFRFLSKVSKRFKTPVIATLLAGFLAGIMALLFTLESLVDMMSIGTLMAYTIVALCVMLLRYADSHLDVCSSEYKLLTYSTDGNSDETMIKGQYEEGEIIQRRMGKYSFKEYTNQLFNIKGLTTPTELTATIASYGTLVFAIVCLAFAAALTILSDYIADGQVGSIVAISILGCLTLLSVIVIARQPESRKKLSFKSPLVPWFPALSTFINWYLMCNLPVETWTRFAVWMALGLSMYILYGVRHSTEEIRAKRKRNEHSQSDLSIPPPIFIETPTPMDSRNSSLKEKQANAPPNIDNKLLHSISIYSQSLQQSPLDTLQEEPEKDSITDADEKTDTERKDKSSIVDCNTVLDEAVFIEKEEIKDQYDKLLEMPLIAGLQEAARIQSASGVTSDENVTPQSTAEKNREFISVSDGNDTEKTDEAPLPEKPSADDTQTKPDVARPTFLSLRKSHELMSVSASNSEPGTPFANKHPFKALKRASSFDEIPPSSPDSPFAKRVQKFIIIPVKHPGELSESEAGTPTRSKGEEPFVKNDPIIDQLNERLTELKESYTANETDEKQILEHLATIRERGESKLLTEEDIKPLLHGQKDRLPSWDFGLPTTSEVNHTDADSSTLSSIDSHIVGPDPMNNENLMKRR